MVKIQYADWEIKSFKESAEGRKYLEYNEKIGGEPIGFIVPFGYPDGVDEMGGVIAVYEKCIEKGVTWEELLEYNLPEDVIL